MSDNLIKMICYERIIGDSFGFIYKLIDSDLWELEPEAEYDLCFKNSTGSFGKWTMYISVYKSQTEKHNHNLNYYTARANVPGSKDKVVIYIPDQISLLNFQLNIVPKWHDFICHVRPFVEVLDTNEPIKKAPG